VSFFLQYLVRLSAQQWYDKTNGVGVGAKAALSTRTVVMFGDCDDCDDKSRIMTIMFVAEGRDRQAKYSCLIDFLLSPITKRSGTAPSWQRAPKSFA
jgi:hypothetical protein